MRKTVIKNVAAINYSLVVDDDFSEWDIKVGKKRKRVRSFMKQKLNMLILFKQLSWMQYLPINIETLMEYFRNLNN